MRWVSSEVKAAAQVSMKNLFEDNFSDDSEGYDRFRPKYPEELFTFLASISTHHQKAWDCATGTGQSAAGLSEYFSEIIATDASKAQIENAKDHKGVRYQVATAENSGIESESIDLITVAQALHWFNIDAFSEEADRVLKTDGIIAIWTYNLFSVYREVDEIINRLYYSVLRGFWPEERRMVESGYRDIRLPFDELEAPAFDMSSEWNMSQVLGYLCTWSAVKQYRGRYGIHPVEDIQDEISEIWGRPEKTHPVQWPLSLRLWKKGHTTQQV